MRQWTSLCQPLEEFRRACYTTVIDKIGGWDVPKFFPGCLFLAMSSGRVFIIGIRGCDNSLRPAE